MGSLFKFKQFEVEQADCAMRINTDGVLLGAILQHPQPGKILDIGTGTGVIAMMLAQRFSQAMVTAVEIDGPAALRAASNFSQSPFAAQLEIKHGDITHFQTAVRYDLIVSNPPYFVNDLKNAEDRKRIARHAGEDFFEGLLRKVAGILAENGKFWVILPVKQAQELVTNAVLFKLYPHRIIHVHSDASKPGFRQIICFGFGNEPLQQEKLYIYIAEGVYTQAYKDLLKDFFLAF
ncbi:tRNA1(Val) (adenine(37)-N6)-methyltransferase [Pedobacter sp.]|uniref:tRNA1(Val) (adenine(37)-N6)-methyltransferase n=1 Tax=Pedobacter sp. TaxID=1411316 RepID=UPI003D7FCA3C